MSEKEPGQKLPPGVNLRINWHFPEGTQSRYADNVLVQVGKHDIVISFFEAQQPILLGEPEENKKLLEDLGSLRVDCVSKIVVSPDFIPALIEALETGLENYYASKEQ